MPDYNDWVWKNEMKIRQKVSEVFNLGREDYTSDHEYNEFLEEREELSKFSQPLKFLYSTDVDDRDCRGKESDDSPAERFQ